MQPGNQTKHRVPEGEHVIDASLVRLAEERHVRDIFTLDVGDFRTYRIHGRQSFRVWPSK